MQTLQSVWAGALTTNEARNRVPTWNDRRTLSSARRRRQLLGLTLARIDSDDPASWLP